MNTEYVAWFVILVAVGVAVVAYLALGPVPEIPATDPAGIPDAASGEAPTHAVADAAPPEANGPAAPAQSPPLSTTEPGPSDPTGTSETP